MENVLFKIGKREVTDKQAVVGLTLSVFLPFVVTIAFLIFMFVAVFINPRARKMILDGKSVLLLCIFCALGVMASIFGGNWLGIICTMGVFAVLALARFVFAASDKEVMERSVKGIRRLMPLVVVFTLAEFATRFYAVVIKDDNIRFMLRCCSYFFNPNFFGATMAMTALLFMWLFIRSSEDRLRNFLAGLAALLCLALSQSLLSCVTFVIGALVLFGVSGKWGYFGAVIACIAVVAAVVILFPNYVPRMDEVAETFDLRLRIWRVAWEGFKENPLYGQGHLTYFHIYPDYVGKLGSVKVWPTQHAHNIFFDSLLNYGVVGAAFLWSYLVSFASSIFKSIRGKAETALAVAVLVTVVLHGMLDVTVIWVQTGLMLTFLMCTRRTSSAEKDC